MRRLMYLAALACALLTAAPASADLVEGAPTPPRYALEDGFLVIDGDQFIDCRGVILTEEGSKLARRCAELGFSLGGSAGATAAPQEASAGASAAAASSSAPEAEAVSEAASAIASAVAEAPAQVEERVDDIPDFVFEEDGFFGEDGSVVIDGDQITDCRSFALEFAGGGVPYADDDSDQEQARRVLEQCEEAGLLESGGTGPSASASASPVAEEAPVATTPEPAAEPAAATTLPETGGPGLFLLPAAGLLLAAGLVGLRVARRRS